jgi:PAB1-binding protein PBP1
MIHKTAKKIEKSRKSAEVNKEAANLVKDLANLEVEQDHTSPQILSFHGEDDYLGISKLSSPNFFIPHKRFESPRFFNALKDEINADFYHSENYLVDRSWSPPQQREVNNSCKCLQNFYDDHSKCS